MAIPFRTKIPKEKDPQYTDTVGETQIETNEEVPLEYTPPLLDFVLKHLKVFIGSLFFSLVLIVVLSFWSWYSARQESIAQTELGQILVKPISVKQFEELDAFVKSVPSSLKKGVLLQMVFIAIELGDTKKAADLYGSLYIEDPKGAVGIIAGLNQAELLQKLGEWQEALSVLNSLEKVASNPILSAIYEGQALCAEQLGEKDIAIAAYKKLIKELVTSGSDAIFYENKIAALINS